MLSEPCQHVHSSQHEHSPWRRPCINARHYMADTCINAATSWHHLPPTRRPSKRRAGTDVTDLVPTALRRVLAELHQLSHRTKSWERYCTQHPPSPAPPPSRARRARRDGTWHGAASVGCGGQLYAYISSFMKASSDGCWPRNSISPVLPLRMADCSSRPSRTAARTIDERSSCSIE